MKKSLILVIVIALILPLLSMIEKSIAEHLDGKPCYDISCGKVDNPIALRSPDPTPPSPSPTWTPPDYCAGAGPNCCNLYCQGVGVMVHDQAECELLVAQEIETSVACAEIYLRVR